MHIRIRDLVNPGFGLRNAGWKSRIRDQRYLINIPGPQHCHIIISLPNNLMLTIFSKKFFQGRPFYINRIRNDYDYLFIFSRK